MAACPTPNLDDIEDLIKTGEDEPTTRMQRHDLQPSSRNSRRRAPKASSAVAEPNDEVSTAQLDLAPHGDNIPGLGSIFIKTWGCAHNNSDGEYMAGLLAQYGYEITEEKDQANLWILNSCTGTPTNVN